MIDLQVGRELMWTSVCESATRVQWVGVSPSSRMYCVQWVAVPALDCLLAISSKWVVERPPLQQALRPCYGDHISTFVLSAQRSCSLAHMLKLSHIVMGVVTQW